MNIKELNKGLTEGKFTSVELTEMALRNIAENDSGGRKLNSIGELNPDALFIARKMDEEIKEGNVRSLLHGIPVVIKDNIAYKDTMHTTAGSFALNDLITKEDSFVVKKLKEAGAVIIGKANLSEFAYWMSTQGMPSGYSSRNGQVVSPYKEGYDPSGSSSGSGVAVAARLVPYAIGTETDGSLTSPGRHNGVFVIKPTIGLVSRTGIIPISSVQDTAGPMCTSVEDCAIVLEVLQGKDEKDKATLTCKEKKYTDSLISDIKGWRIGYVNIKDAELNEYRKSVEEKVKDTLRMLGAEVMEIELPSDETDEYPVLFDEFKNGMENYLASVRGLTKMEHLSDIIEFNRNNKEKCLRYGQDLLEKSDEKSGLLIEADYINERLRLNHRAHELLDGTIDKYDLKCLVSIRDNNLCPVSGNPVVAIPADNINEEEPDTVSIKFMGKAYEEDVLIRCAYTVEQEMKIKPIPSWCKEFGE